MFCYMTSCFYFQPKKQQQQQQKHSGPQNSPVEELIATDLTDAYTAQR